jgi:DNA-binding transcriptional ArsR family regulator
VDSGLKADVLDLKPPGYVNETLAKALGNPVRVKILDELNRQPMSVSQFVRAFPQYTHAQAYGHFRRLETDGFIEVVEVKTGGKRRGATEYFYRARARSLFDETSWADLPDSLKSKVTGAVFTTYIERVAEAVKAGTIDIRPERHFSWSDPHFDQQAWEETIAEVDAVFHRIPIRKAEATRRLAERSEEPIPVTVALACFESPTKTLPADP